jgi:hypothetical protein
MALTTGEIDWILHDNVNTYLYNMEGQQAILANEYEITTVEVPRVDLLNAIIDNCWDFDPYERFFKPLMQLFHEPLEHVLVPDDGDRARDILGAKSILPIERSKILVPLMEEVARHDSAFVYDRVLDQVVRLQGGEVDTISLGMEPAFAYALLQDHGYDTNDLMLGADSWDLDYRAPTDGSYVARDFLARMDPVPFTREAMAHEWAQSAEGKDLIEEASKVRTPVGNLVIRRNIEDKFPGVQVYLEGLRGGADLVSQTEWESEWSCLHTLAYDAEHDEPQEIGYDLRGIYAPSMAPELLESLGSQAEEEER